MDRIELQNREFDAVERLSEQYRRIQLTPVVDRRDYENAVKGAIEAFKANGRI